MEHDDYLPKTNEGIFLVIDKLRCYTEDGFIASLYVRKYSELKIQMHLAEVRQCLAIVHYEYLNLTDYSLRFNEQWATEDNKRYSSAQQMFRLLKSTMESIKKEFKRTCPISHSKPPTSGQKISVFQDSVLTRGGCARDLFGIESFKDSIQALFYEQRALFTNVLGSLMVCREVIRKEELIRADEGHCIELLERQCDEIVEHLKDSIDFTQAPVTCEIQHLIEEKGLAIAAQQGFHKFDVRELTAYALMRNARQQPKVVSLSIEKCYRKSEDIRLLFKHFKDFRPEPTRKKPTALKVLFAVNWMGGTAEPLRSCYDLLAANFDGELPQWHTVSIRKNSIPDFQDQQKRFNSELEAFLEGKKGQEAGRNTV